MTRFNNYWRPALISTGTVTQTPELRMVLQKIRKAYQMNTSLYIGQHRTLLSYPSVQKQEFYNVPIKEIVHEMMRYGTYRGMIDACRYTYKSMNIFQFKNTSFTFNQFLQHVVWTHEQGMPDLHWMTYTESCDPCRRKQNYILKLETVQEEMNHLFQHVLGFPEKISFPVLHASIGHSLGQSDRQYYASVTPELMQRILHIYRHDLALFGYKHDVY